MCSNQFNEVVIIIIVIGLAVLTSSKSTNCSSAETSIECNDLDKDQSYESAMQCKSRKHFINPDDLINSNSSDDEHWEFDQNFTQSIEVEKCENEGSPCSEDSPFKTMCKQKFLTIQLQVMLKNTTQSELKTFSIPSNCECAYFKA